MKLTLAEALKALPDLLAVAEIILSDKTVEEKGDAILDMLDKQFPDNVPFEDAEKAVLHVLIEALHLNQTK